MKAIRLSEKLAQISEPWDPKIIGEMNGQEVRLAKLKGEFVWHHHADSEELFLIVEGRMKMLLPDQEIELEKGDLFIVPRGVEHCPVAEEECHVLLFEGAGTRNTGQYENDRTVDPERI